jgi:probable rRNA maturation factor
VSVDVLDESGWGANLGQLTRLGRFVLDRMRIHPRAELCIKLVDEETISNLNQRYLEKTGPTDVLAFPMDELDAPPGPNAAEAGPALLGDVVLCPEYARRGARQAGHSLAEELRLLTTHGVLHLLGYDHAEPEEEREMFGLQADLLAGWPGSARSR